MKTLAFFIILLLSPAIHAQLGPLHDLAERSANQHHPLTFGDFWTHVMSFHAAVLAENTPISEMSARMLRGNEINNTQHPAFVPILGEVITAPNSPMYLRMIGLELLLDINSPHQPTMVAALLEGKMLPPFLVLKIFHYIKAKAPNDLFPYVTTLLKGLPDLKSHYGEEIVVTALEALTHENYQMPALKEEATLRTLANGTIPASPSIRATAIRIYGQLFGDDAYEMIIHLSRRISDSEQLEVIRYFMSRVEHSTELSQIARTQLSRHRVALERLAEERPDVALPLLRQVEKMWPRPLVSLAQASEDMRKQIDEITPHTFGFQVIQILGDAPWRQENFETAFLMAFGNAFPEETLSVATYNTWFVDMSQMGVFEALVELGGIGEIVTPEDLPADYINAIRVGLKCAPKFIKG